MRREVALARRPARARSATAPATPGADHPPARADRLAPPASRPAGEDYRPPGPEVAGPPAAARLPAAAVDRFQPLLPFDLAAVAVEAPGAAATEWLAPAVTVGQVISFAPGMLELDTEQGYRRVAHELVHVGQQLTPGDAEPGGSAEQEAEAGGTRCSPAAR